MSLFCIHCGTPLRPEDVNPSTGVARCHVCGQMFDTVNRGGTVGGGAAPAQQVVPRPAHMHVEHQGRRLTIRWRWFTPAMVFVACFCVAWDSFLLFWYSMAFGDRHVPWIAIVFPIAHVAVGVGLTYATLCAFVNSTTLEISPDGLTIRHGPLPWRGNRYLPSTQIRQPFCEQRLNTNTRGRSTNTSVTYHLSALLNDGSKTRLVSGLNDISQAIFLKKQIELAMDIKPQPVAGECVA